MASLTVSGLSELALDLDELAALPKSVMEEMINAESDIVVRAQKEKARSMLSGPYSKGIVSSGITKKKARLRADGVYQMITVDGTVLDQHHKNSTRIAEIAFINEFGKTNQPARPFMRTANEESADEAVNAAYQVYDKYLKSKNL